MRSLPRSQSTPGAGRGTFTLRGFKWLLVVLLGAAFIAPRGQQVYSGQQGTPGQLGQRSHSPFDGVFDNEDNAFAKRQMNALNAERQKKLVSDTEKLVKLAQELNTEIATDNRDSLSSDQIRKLSDIEKLAHTVKQKMSETVLNGPSLHDPISPVR
jgi:hypothetical protein